MSSKETKRLTPFGDPVETDPFYGDEFGIGIHNFLATFGRDTPYRIGKGIQEFVVKSFFREVTVRGIQNVPFVGPVIFVCGPHANQFMDGGVISSFTPRKVGFVMAKTSMDKPYLGRLARLTEAIPVKRPQDYVKKGQGTITIDEHSAVTLRGTDTEFTKFSPRWTITLPNKDKAEVLRVVSDTELVLKAPFADPTSAELLSKGSTYRVTPHFDQNVVFAGVHDRLISGGTIGIFPEGGSHDQPELLPLKAGFSLMALGAMAKQPGLDVKLVPTGLTYFNRDKFRSTAVLEFGAPISVPQEFVEKYKAGGAERRSACDALVSMAHDGLKAVTINAPDHDTLLLIQTIRRLYRPTNRKLDPGENLELTRRLIAGYVPYKDQPRHKALRARTAAYTEKLNQLGIHDHQVNNMPVSTLWVAGRLLYRIGQLGLFAALALPGAIITLPVGLVASVVSETKRKEAKAHSSVKLTGQDVIASWKIIIAGAYIPLHIGINTAALLTYLVYKHKLTPLSALAASPAVAVGLTALGYFTYRMTETLFSVYRSIKPLTIALLKRNATAELRAERAALQHDIYALVNDTASKVLGGNPDQIRLVSKQEAHYNEFMSDQLAKGVVPTEEESFRYVQQKMQPKVGLLGETDKDLFGFDPNAEA
ncbi:hypothetical protein M427DRAFT_59376 [Gonapodya prolifera JEL478]|uniref:Phospholipid/glycerol acyltransferase domain-containing protein n=1 Tax=Gonapodya prolifera (strain JEL478) TaxID=1344416 RepID=A0A139A780_GONPJ|nr:hypothetical protein M427DRAFT_59376 [Gonapodya prolifera JEL478]|eukprot:KXS12637.1 hypothetical protein M427DRAFT_59376 [Gonapodya prolifera JEL478]